MNLSDKKWDVLAVGGVDVDCVLTVHRLPGRDEKVAARFEGRFPGGPAGNFACAASRLGLAVASAATIGRDDDGRLVAADFERYGVDTRLLAVDANYPTPFTVIMIDESGERAIVVPDFIERYPLGPLFDALEQARCVYMMPVMFAEFMQITGRALDLKLEVMVDIEANHALTGEQFEQALKNVTIASFNHSGFRRFTGLEPAVDAARRLLSDTLHTVLISRGSKGSLAVTHEDEALVPAFSVPVVDTTGAGDAFNAGFLTGTFMGLPLDQRLRLANGVAALKIQHIGTRGYLPALDETRQWIEQYRIEETK